MPSFVTVAANDTAQAVHIQQVIDALSGVAGTGNIPISITAINDGTNYALDVRNAESTNARAFRVLDNTGANAMVTITSSGMDVSASTAGGSLSRVANITAAQTFQNKTLSIGTIVNLGTIAAGDLYYGNSSGELVRLAIGSSAFVLESTGGVPAWRAHTMPFSVWIDAFDFELPTSSGALSDKWESTNSTQMAVRVLRYDFSSMETAFAKFVLPTGAAVSSVVANIHWSATAAGGAGSSQVMWTLFYNPRSAG